MLERESTRASDSAATPTQRDVYRETAQETTNASVDDGAARSIYEERVSGPAGEQVVHTERVSVPSAATRRGIGVTRIKQAIYFIFGVINVLLTIRFVLLLLGADEVSGFVSLIYGLSYAFVLPFRGIFAEPVLGASVFEWAALVGIAVYSLVAYGIVRIVELVYAPARPT
ncbi:MAG: YggT family protein, partial [Oscillochloris sp.]|nr:YggT family protein [Oscillochloris sp.]